MKRIGFLVAIALVLGGLGCSSAPKVNEQAYARLSDQRTFEYEFPAVWKAIEETFRNYKVTDRDPETVDPNKWNEVRSRELKTDWIYGQSRDKSIQYTINGAVRKKPLQVRYRTKVKAKSVIGGITVIVGVDEEIERLDKDGKPTGYESVDSPDPARARDTLEKIQMALLGASP